MALSLRDLKGVDFSCASPASSSITTSIYRQPMGRAIDRHSPHLRDPLRAKSLNPQPQAPQPPSKPKHMNQKCKEKLADHHLIISPVNSSRYLLNGMISSETFLESSEPFPPAPVPNEHGQSRFMSTKREDSASLRPSCSSTSPTSGDQVVVLRVSLHCKGCEGKVRKHISKMKGVTSFNTDLASKKVTVTGDVTPLGVLNSISKVKSAQFWPSSSLTNQHRIS